MERSELLFSVGGASVRRACGLVLVVLGAAFTAASAEADVFAMPSGQTSLQFVTVGDPGNVPDTTGYGSVPYVYQMGKYDVTIGQYVQFLNAVAKADPYVLYNDSALPIGGGCFPFGIARSGASGAYTYSITGTYGQAANCPMFDISWGSAARFCNWLQNGQPNGPEGNGTTETGAYTLNGARYDNELLAITRNAGAKYFLPSENEWYKAAYYKGRGTNSGYWAYPTQSDTVPSNVFSSTGTNNANYDDVDFSNDANHFTDPTYFLTPVGAFGGSPGPYGTFDQGGNVFNMTEGLSPGARVMRGGAWNDPDMLVSSHRDSCYPSQMGSGIGFRVASVPEPGTCAMLLAGAITACVYLFRRRHVAKN